MTEVDKMNELRKTASRRIQRGIELAELAELASTEQNPAKLLVLLQELNTLLAKEKWLRSSLADEPGSNGSDGNSQD